MPKVLISVREALQDERLLGTAMPGATFAPHRVFLIAAHGEELTSEERELWKYYTGREREPLQRCRRFFMRSGRRTNKTGILAAASFIMLYAWTGATCCAPVRPGSACILPKTD